MDMTLGQKIIITLHHVKRRNVAEKMINRGVKEGLIRVFPDASHLDYFPIFRERAVPNGEGVESTFEFSDKSADSQIPNFSDE